MFTTRTSLTVRDSGAIDADVIDAVESFLTLQKKRLGIVAKQGTQKDQ
jgi:hypothetical protein